MTASQIGTLLDLPAGPELDVAVARHVMRMSECTKFLCLPEYGCRCPIHGDRVEWPRGHQWQPSTNFEDCGMMLGQIEELGLYPAWAKALSETIVPERGRHFCIAALAVVLRKAEAAK